MVKPTSLLSREANFRSAAAARYEQTERARLLKQQLNRRYRERHGLDTNATDRQRGWLYSRTWSYRQRLIRKLIQFGALDDPS